MISSYNTLLTEVSNWLAKSNLSSDAPTFVQLWEEEFYNDSENWGSWMESALSVASASGVCALPSDYLGLRVAYWDGESAAPLKRISLDQLYQRYPRDSGTTGTPRYIARNASNFEFGPIPSSGTVAGTYYAKPALLRDDGDGTNWIITNAPNLPLFGALAEAELFIKNDKRAGIWQAKYDKALDAYRRRMRGEDYSGSPPHVVAV